MKRVPCTVLALVVALISASAAEAGPIVFFDSYRSLNASGQFFETTATGSWTRSASSSGPDWSQNGFQFSNIGENRFRVDGTPYTRVFSSQSVFGLSRNPNAPAVDNYSSLFTSFMIDSQYTAMIDVSLDGGGDAFAEGYLFNRTTNTMVATAQTNDSDARLLYNGLLDPGIYDYFLYAQVVAPAGRYEGHGTAVGDLDLQAFTPVPEPATMTLFGVGLAAIRLGLRKR